MIIAVLLVIEGGLLGGLISTSGDGMSPPRPLLAVFAGNALIIALLSGFQGNVPLALAFAAVAGVCFAILSNRPGAAA